LTQVVQVLPQGSQRFLEPMAKQRGLPAERSRLLMEPLRLFRVLRIDAGG